MPNSGPIDLTGKVAIVTGGARGIGRAICTSLARAGADVVVTDLLKTDDTETVIKSFNRRAMGIKVDVTKQEEVQDVIAQTMQKFNKIDILVTNAGVMAKTGRPVEELPIAEFYYHIDVNLKGAYLFCQAVWPIMMKQKSGKIVCLGSVAGQIGGVLAGPDYVASKGGIHAMAKCLAKKGAASGIYVNAVAPGPVLTEMTKNEPYKPEMTPLMRLGTPEDIAEPVVFLCSDASNFITGITLDVNGGIYMG